MVVLQSASVVANNGGVGYQIGDVVGIVTSTVTGATGSGAQISITGVGDRNMIFVENIQGDIAFSQSTGNNLFYYNDSGNCYRFIFKCILCIF